VTGLLEDFHLADEMKCWHCESSPKLLAWRIHRSKFTEVAQCPVCWQVCSVERLVEATKEEE
jgi:hypothetical protein